MFLEFYGKRFVFDSCADFYCSRFISEIHSKTKHLAYRADYDMLTGVLNRDGFISRAGKC